jgi:hypothetical protein
VADYTQVRQDGLDWRNIAISLKTPVAGSMHYERAALLSGVYRGDVRQESEEKIGKSAEEWHFTLRERLG